MRKIIVMTVLLFVGCAKESVYQTSFEKIDHASDSAYVSRYFLPELPNWINFSNVGKCRRNSSIKYLNFEQFRNSFALSYESAIQFQLLYNTGYLNLKSVHKTEYVTPQSEKKLFFEILDKIKADIEGFRIPKYKRINLVWIDPFYR